tara:strand:- start:331 stop:879 length:549 start_codon:yes stop_codon:yes gene_type:complete
MKGVQEKLEDFSVVGVKPGFMTHDQEGPDTAFENINQNSFEGKWKIFYFYPKDFTFVCPTEIAEFANLNDDFNDRDAILLGGSTDNEHCKLAWRRAHDDLHELNHWSFADTTGSLVDMLGIRSDEGVSLRATFIVDPHNVIQHVSVNNLDVGRNPKDTLRILDALQTDELCACNRPLGGDTL